MGETKILINTEYIKLDQFLKWCGIADTGGTAREIITGEDVYINGEIETRRGRKLRPGDRVDIFGRTFVVSASGEDIDS